MFDLIHVAGLGIGFSVAGVGRGGGVGGGGSSDNNVILDDEEDGIMAKGGGGMDLGYHHFRTNSHRMMDPGEAETCLSQSSSTMSMPVCRICQLPSMEPSNMLISPCRCLGSIRYVHNNCLLVSTIEYTLRGIPE